MSLPPVKAERTRWRDLALNERHRLWGWDCPATDLDFLEYDDGEPVALMEYKQEFAEPAFPSSSNIRAMVRLGNRASVPVFGVRYAADFSWWKVKPLNMLAAKYVPRATEMSEREYVTLLYRMRNRALPHGLFPLRSAS